MVCGKGYLSLIYLRNMKSTYIALLSVAFLFSCSTKNNSNFENQNETLPAIISGKILNLEVYPDVKEVNLIIPGFKGDETRLTTKINDSGQFLIKFYPKTKREIKLPPIEDIMVVQPGDSLYVIKDFKDIGNTTFYGSRAELNKQISRFRGQYLGRYSTDYKKSYLEYKNDCEKEKNDNYQKLIDFQESNACTDEFNSWSIKQIELDYCKELFNYPLQHYLSSKTKLTDSSEYFSFIENLEEKVDNSIVMSDYFKTTEQYEYYQINKLQNEHKNQIIKEDSFVGLVIGNIFSNTENNYLAQFTLRSFLNRALISNKTDLIYKYSEQINSRLVDPFLKNNFQENYNRANEFNNYPKRVSDAILSSNGIEVNNKISLLSGNEKNTVKGLIDKHPNKVIYVEFWAPWCPPCLHSLQYSKQLMTYFKNKDVEFVFICVNTNKKFWRQKVDELKMGGEHIYYDAEATRSIREKLGFFGIPYYLLINNKGVIVDFGYHLNPKNKDVKTRIEKLLKE
jgi:thiol-disulfide isomerase/thioredoxin